MLERIQTTMSAVKTRLLNDSTVRKLLYYDTTNALDLEAPSAKQMGNKYITLRPIFEFENKGDYSQNSIVNIYTTEISPLEDTQACVGVLQINVVCNLDLWELDDAKIRPMQLAEKVIQLVHNQKLTVSNKIVFNSMTDLIISKKMVGYALLFEITDGSGEIDKF